jgi:phytoene synthase
MDLSGYHYETFDQLRLYCYRVASTVGLMSSEVFGYRDATALGYAEALGIAMQLTNILRDIGEDLRAGRIYLPADELKAFNYTAADLAANRIDQRFIALMKFQIARARTFYQQADAGIKLLSRDTRLTVLAASRLYGGILGAIERNNYDVFTHRASLSLSGKLARLPIIWFTCWLKFH